MCKHKIGADGWEKPRDTIFTRYRLRRICAAMGGIILTRWQRDYVFGLRAVVADMPSGSGKTTACLVKLLMWYRGVIDRREPTCAEILGDPDYYAASRKSRNYYMMEIADAHRRCAEHGIRVFRIIPEQRARWWRP